jgi:hypothetical protein
MASQPIFVRHIALPQDHGSWVFLLSPLLIGLFAGIWPFEKNGLQIENFVVQWYRR